MSEKYYGATNHIFFSENNNNTTIKAKSGQNLNIECNNIIVNTGSFDSAFKYSRRSQVGSQAITAFIDTPILFNTSNVDENTKLIVSSSGGGSLFTATTNLKLLITWSFRYTNNSGTIYQTWLKASNATAYFGQNHCYDTTSNPAISSSCIINLPTNSSFRIFTYTNVDNSISSNNTTNASSVQVYSLL